MNSEQPIPQDQMEEIDRFLSNEMTAEEEARFRDRLSQDPKLQQYTNEMKWLTLGIQEAALESKMADFHRQLEKKGNGAHHSGGRVMTMGRWLAAASVLLVVAFAAYFFTRDNNNAGTLYSNYYQPDPGLVTAMGSTDSYEFDRAMIEYKTGNYKNAINAWQALSKKDAANDTLNYFLGSAYLAENNVDSARMYFLKVTAQPSSFFARDANWYLGLIEINKGNTESAKAYIEKSDHSKKDLLLEQLAE